MTSWKAKAFVLNNTATPIAGAPAIALGVITMPKVFCSSISETEHNHATPYSDISPFVVHQLALHAKLAPTIPCLHQTFTHTLSHFHTHTHSNAAIPLQQLARQARVNPFLACAGYGELLGSNLAGSRANAYAWIAWAQVCVCVSSWALKNNTCMLNNLCVCACSYVREPDVLTLWQKDCRCPATEPCSHLSANRSVDAATAQTCA